MGNAKQKQSRGMAGEIVSINISRRRGQAKHPVQRAECDMMGIKTDAHRGTHARQVSLLASEEIENFNRVNHVSIRPGEFAENITTAGLNAERIALFDHIKIGNDVLLEVTAIGKKCHQGCPIFDQLGKCVMPANGIFCRVVRGGTILPGDRLQVVPRPLSLLVITLSTRAFHSEYEDRSGPAAKEALISFFESGHWRYEIKNDLLPDDDSQLTKRLQDAVQQGVDLIFTCGGTGIGKDDIVPETVCKLADKVIPGIPEAIRARFGAGNPMAYLSRSVVAVMDETIVYTLPGSPAAVREYISEITRTLEHVVFMVRGIDVHD